MLSRLRYRFFLFREQIRTYLACLDDAHRYLKASFTGFSRQKLPRGRLQGRLIATSHVVEKGLGMPEMRPRFGESAIRALKQLLDDYEATGPGFLDNHYQSAVCNLNDYVRRHEELGIDVSDLIGKLPSVEISDSVGGGAFPSDPDHFFRAVNAPFNEFSRSRHSTRHFEEMSVSPQVIEDAVRLALRAPSACNRQPWKVYAFLKKEEVSKIMKLHNGSRGFGDSLPGVLIVAARMDTFSGPGERNQSYVDGGLLSMSLMYSLHHYRLGCVPLNWSVVPGRDRKLKSVAGVRDDENIIMLLGVGHPASSSRIPVSQRRDVSEVLRIGFGS